MSVFLAPKAVVSWSSISFGVHSFLRPSPRVSVPCISLNTAPAMSGMLSAQSQNSRITYWSSAMTSQLSVGRPTSCAADRSAATPAVMSCRVRHRLQLVDLIAGEIQVLERVGGDRLLRLDARRDIGRAVGVVAAALRRDLVEQPLGRRHVHHADDFAAAARLPEDHHVVGIAAEGLDVVLHPLQRHHQIGRAGVARVRVLRTVGREIQRAEDVQPVVHADHHDVAELAERAAVVGVRLHRRAVGEAAAVHPHHDRLLRRRGEVLASRRSDTGSARWRSSSDAGTPARRR